MQVTAIVNEKPAFKNLWGMLGTKKVVATKTLETKPLAQASGLSITPNYILTVVQ